MYDKVVVEDAVHHILQHTDQESWGSTDFHLPGLVTEIKTSKGVSLWKPGDETKINMPCLRREGGVNETWRSYLKSRPEGSKRIGENAHRNLVQAVTATQRKARAGVNYVEGNHLHDPLQKLHSIAKETPSWPAKLYLGGLRYFCKSEYLQRHVGQSGCSSHSDAHALFGEATADPGCEGCQLPFLVLADLKRVAAVRHHALIDDCGTHFETYMAYQLRVGNARAGIAAREAEQTEEDVVEQLDYMMTFQVKPLTFLATFLPAFMNVSFFLCSCQALYGLETTVKFFGKRGMLLHGTEAHFKTPGGERETHYFNHIAEHDMKQDWCTVLALFESKLRMLKEIKPSLKRVSPVPSLAFLLSICQVPFFYHRILPTTQLPPQIFMLTDSACCYLDGTLYYWMLVLCRKYGILMYARYYPAEQDGKGGIDAIFATQKRFLYALQNKGIDTATPRQLYENLSSRPQNNFKTEMFEIDRARIAEMVEDPKHAVGVALFKRIKRFGEAVFDGKVLRISEYHGRVDLTIEFNADFSPHLVDTGGDCGLFADDNEDDKFDEEDDEMLGEDVELAMLQRSGDEEDSSSQVSFHGRPLEESHQGDETVTVLPNTHTKIRRLSHGFKLQDSNNRTHQHKRHRSGIATKTMRGGGVKPQTKQREKAQPAATKDSDGETVGLGCDDDIVVARGSVATKDLVHEGLILDAPDTAVCWMCRKWFSPPSARDGHVCDTDRTVHVDLTTYGLMYASHYILSGNHDVIQRGTAKETDSSSSYLDKISAAIHPDTRAAFTPVVFQPGWARRPKRGAGKGASYIGPYRERIFEMFMAGEDDKRQRKAPTQMLELLSQENPGVIALPGYNEVSSFVGSLIARVKKYGRNCGMPKARAPPITNELATEIESLDLQWERSGHRIRGRVYTKLALYEEIKARHTTLVNGSAVLPPDFPSQGKIDSLIAKQRKERRAGAAGGAASANLLRVVPAAARNNAAGEPPQSKVGSKFTKHFEGHGKHVGTVTKFDLATGRHHVKYPDGDEEDLDWPELSELLRGGGAVPKTNKAKTPKKPPTKKRKASGNHSSSDDGVDLVGSCFEDEGVRCEVTGFGDDDDGRPVLFYNLPTGEEVFSQVSEVREWVQKHKGGAQ